MTRNDRESLSSLIRQQAKLGRTMAEQRAAELLADGEAQLAAIYKVDDEAWRDLTAGATAAVRKADAMLAKRCRELGIPEEFRPSLNVSWYGRGESASKERRAELRKVMQSRVEALRAAAVTRIEAAALEGQAMLVRDGLDSAEAIAFLDAMPTPEVLMPKLDVLLLSKERRETR